MGEDKIYQLNGEVQAVKQEVKDGFAHVNELLSEMKDVFQTHVEESNEQYAEFETVRDRINKIELRVGMIVGAGVLVLQAVGKWVIAHVFSLLN